MKNLKQTNVRLSLAIIISLFLIACATNDNKFSSEESSDCMKFLFENNLDKIKEKSTECLSFRDENGINLLMMAATKGYADIAEYLLQNGVNINSVNHIKQGALHFAVIHKQSQMIDLLVHNGAEIKANNFGITPLMMAIQLGTYEMVTMLNPKFEDVNIAADDGWTAIYFAIRKQDDQILQYLLERGACINISDSYSQTPLDFAKETGWAPALAKIKKGKVCKNN